MILTATFSPVFLRRLVNVGLPFVQESGGGLRHTLDEVVLANHCLIKCAYFVDVLIELAHRLPVREMPTC